MIQQPVFFIKGRRDRLDCHFEFEHLCSAKVDVWALWLGLHCSVVKFPVDG